MNYETFAVSVNCDSGDNWVKLFTSYAEAAGYKRYIGVAGKARMYGYNGNKDLTELDVRI